MTWDAELRGALRRLRNEDGRRAVVGPAEGPGGPWVAFRERPNGTLLLETDSSQEREVEEREAIEAAAAALADWGLVDGDPLTCFLEDVDRDPVEDDPYDGVAVRGAFARARWHKRSLRLDYEALVGPVRMIVDFPNRRRADVEVVAPKPANGAQARRLPELGLTGTGDRWAGRVSAAAAELEALVPSIWSRVRDVRIEGA